LAALRSPGATQEPFFVDLPHAEGDALDNFDVGRHAVHRFEIVGVLYVSGRFEGCDWTVEFESYFAVVVLQET
jgi:hypothetical protein